MVEHTGIEWATHTWNPWVGCTKISAGCDHCYAETLVMARMQNMPQGKPGWGPHGARVATAERNWQYPHRWAREAVRSGTRPRVFTLSLGDFFDNQAAPYLRSRAWDTMRYTPELDWLVLTKRPQNIRAMLPGWWGDGLPNVWLGCTVENQEEANRRIPHLLAVPAARHWLSCEPLLGPVDLRNIRIAPGEAKALITLDALTGRHWTSLMHMFEPGQDARAGLGQLPKLPPPLPGIDWVICGGETGRGARAMTSDWARSLRDQCKGAGVPFFMKQMGGISKARQPIIPDDLLVRQFPGNAALDAAA